MSIKNIHGVRFTDSDIKALEDATRAVLKIRSEQYDKAVESLKTLKANTTLSKKINEAEIKNLVIPRPAKPTLTLDDFTSSQAFRNYVRQLNLSARYGVEDAERQYAENYLKAVESELGEDVAKQVRDIIKDNPGKLIEGVNSKSLSSIGFVYNKSKEEQKKFVREIADYYKK